MTDRGLHAVWLGTRAVLVAGPVDETQDASPPRIAVKLGDRAVPLEVEALTYGDPQRPAVLAVGHLPSTAHGGQATAATVGEGDAAPTIPMEEFERCGERLRTLVREELSGLPAERRAEVLAFVLAATRRYLLEPGSQTLARRLSRLREALREQLPRVAASADQPYAVDVDSLYEIDPEAFWLKGWVHDEDGMLAALTAVSPEGARAGVLDGAFRHARIDVQERYAAPGGQAEQRHGFITCLTLPSPSRLPAGWVVELRSSTGAALEVQAPAVERDIVTVRSHVLRDLEAERPGEEVLMREQVHPALQRIQHRLEQAVEIDAVVDVGPHRPARPEVSVIVPLYKRIDFVEHQLAQFAHDPELAAADLVYVLDSPEITDNLLDAAHALSALHEVPLRVVVLKRNAGFSGANNAAVSVARGRRLVLLNSDVIPDRPGWLGRMGAFYDATPQIGALGPKLLYEDESIQHAGLYFYRTPGSAQWGNQHYFKGMHRSFPAANIARPVPGVTAACMMLDRDLYEQAGGLSHAYVQGGYEDSDLCLQLIERGRQNWYMPGAELYHLEAQSYPSQFRKLATKYNMWLHTQRWNERIEAVCEEYSGQAPRGIGSVVAEPAR